MYLILPQIFPIHCVCLPENEEKLLHKNLETLNYPFTPYQTWMQWHRKGFDSQGGMQKEQELHLNSIGANPVREYLSSME